MTSHVAFWWQCETPKWCPEACTHDLRGHCSTTAKFACTCDGLTSFKVLTFILAAASTLVSVVVVSVSSYKYFYLETFRRSCDRYRLVLWSQCVCTVVPPVVQALFLLIVLNASTDNQPQACMSLGDVAVVFYPSLVMNLFANEHKRVLRAWVPPLEPVGIS